MRVLIVFNHPYEHSFCNAILKSVQFGLRSAGHEVDLIHLDNDNFDPVMRAKDLKAFAVARSNPDLALEMLDDQVIEYKARITAAQHIIFIFPIWWELMPALMKGFIDKLIFPGISYGYKGNRMVSTLDKLSGVTMITTMNTPSFAYNLLFGNAIKKAMLLGTFWKIGIKNRKWVNLSSVKSASDKQRTLWLEKISADISKL